MKNIFSKSFIEEFSSHFKEYSSLVRVDGVRGGRGGRGEGGRRWVNEKGPGSDNRH